MGTPIIIQLPMNDANLRRLIAETAAVSAQVQVTKHARQRMRQRRVSLTQVLKVLQEGVVVEPAHQNIHGNWQCALEKTVAGDRVRVAAALIQEGGTTVVVITVMN